MAKSGKLRVKIIGVGKKDAFHTNRARINGLVGVMDIQRHRGHGFYHGTFVPDKPAVVHENTDHDTTDFLFYSVRIREVE